MWRLGNSQVRLVATLVAVVVSVGGSVVGLCNLVFDIVCLGNIHFGSHHTKPSCNKNSSSQLRRQCQPSQAIQRQ
jgi:hypothetical protein